jgi:hypothetical protein
VSGTLTINPPPVTAVLDTLLFSANAAVTTAPSLVMNATVLPISPLSLPGNVLFGGETVLPYGDDTGAIPVNTNLPTSNTSSTNQQTPNASVDVKRRRILAR